MSRNNGDIGVVVEVEEAGGDIIANGDIEVCYSVLPISLFSLLLLLFNCVVGCVGGRWMHLLMGNFLL